MRRHILTSSIIAVFFILNSACLAAPPVLEVSPTYMEFTAEQGGANPPGQALSIWRGGGNGPLKWQVTEDCNWIEVTPDSGTSMGEVDVAGVFVDISELAAGIYGCELTVTGDRAANSPQIVDVNLIITGPEIELSATHFDFSAFLGGLNPADQVLGISNSGSGTLNWQITDDCSWLSAEPNSGSSTGEVDDVNLSVDITGLGIGIYDCNLIVSDSSAGNSPQTASVTLSITMAEGIWVNPDSFDVDVIEGTTLTEVLTIGNGSDTDVNYILRAREISREVLGGYSAGRSPVGLVNIIEDKIILEYEFSEPAISKRAEYDFVQIEGLELYERIGAPIVPVRPVTVVVPFGKRVVSSKVIPLASYQLAGTYQLPPAQEPYPLSYEGIVEQTGPDPAIYSQAAPWPGIEHEEVTAQSKRGYRLFTVNLFPVQYTPVTGELTYTTKLRLEIDLADSAPTNVLRPSLRTTSSLRNMVDNPGVLETYSSKDTSVQMFGEPSPLPGGGPYQYVIITSSTLESAPGPYNFQALRNAKISQGITATIVTTDWIYANYDGTRPDGGSDNQTRIRNFLIDAYQTWGTEYVLLGGTDSIVPDRKFWVQAWAGGDTTNMPVDMYYGCVDPDGCTFDYDADGNYGEPTDGVGGSDVDLYAEIYVGRAPVENATELGHFIGKTLTYDSTYSEYLPRTAMVGEHLGFGGVAEYAKDSMEQIRLGGDYDGYFTYGFENHTHTDFVDFNTIGCLPDNPSFCWPLYDKDGSWPKSNLIDLMNGGIHIFNHLGHANYTYCMKLNTSDLTPLTNTDYFFAYSQGCMPGGFDTSNCFAEVLTTMEHGAFAAVMNARYGWGQFNSTDGPSQRFDRQFWDAVLNEDMLEIGRANQDSKEDNLWDINGECIRWCYYELNLFGDPQQQFRIEKACEWLTIEPEEGTVGPWDSNNINVTFDAFEHDMEMAPGTYQAEIIVISNDACNPTIIVPATMTVAPDDLAVIPQEGFDANGIEGGPFEPLCKTYTLTNNGTTSINWTTSQTESWLKVEPNTGVLDANTSIDVNICVTADANLLDPNIYTELLIFENTESNSIKPRPVTLTVKPPDCFTQSLVTNLDFLSLMFSPDGSNAYYEACRERVEAFPIDPNGGTAVPLGDDDFAEVILTNDANILFYGTRYDRFYIGSNGYITFGAGDSNSSASLVNHFNLPRISALFTDLDPTGGQVSYKQLDESVVVTFQDVPLSGNPTATNSFQIEMFFIDGSICVSWLELLATSGVAGLSKGRGLPPVFFVESDLGGYLPCCLWGDFSRDYYVNLIDFATLAMHWLDEDCGIPYWCELTDLDFSSIVDSYDLGIFVENWLAKDEWWLEPLGHWKLDKGDGNTAYDSSGFNHGTIEGATWTSGKFDGALSFDGVDDYVGVNNPDNLNFGSSIDFTFAAWIKAETSQRKHPAIIGRRNPGNAHGYIFFLHSYGKLAVQLNDGIHSNYISTGPDLSDDTWHHVAATGDRDGYLIFYIDGVQAGQNNISGKGNIDSTANLYIGWEERHATLTYFNGIIDEVRIYSRVLSESEIRKLAGLDLELAYNPSPCNGATGVDPNTILSWSPGEYATLHDVYFGTGYNDVNDATTSSTEYKGNYDVNNYDPCGLDLDTAYYWRIDEVNDPNLWKGDVWNFTTAEVNDPNFVSWWKFDEGSGTTAHDSAGDNDGTVYGATWATGQIDGALDFDGVDDYVEIPDSLSMRSIDGNTAEYTICLWVNTTQPGAELFIGPAIFDRRATDALSGKKHWVAHIFLNENNAISFLIHNQFNGGTPFTLNDDMAVNNGIWHHVVVTRKNTEYVKIYVDGNERQSGATTISTSTTEITTIGVRRSNSNVYKGYFNGKIDDARIYNRALSAEEIWQLYQEETGGKAFNPNPADTATNVDPDIFLSWSPGKGAVLHDVYFGTNYNDVNDATTSSTEYKGQQDANSWDPNGLNLETAYYWRIDEVNDPNLWKGDVWSFTTSVEFDPNLNLVSLWKFDEGSGSTAYDSAGDNDGTIYGATWTTGQIDGALDFDGVDDYVNCGNDANLNPLNTISISAWIYPNALTTAHHQTIVMREGVAYQNYIFWIPTRGGTGDNLEFIVGNGSSNSFHLASGVISAGKWQHVAVTMDGGRVLLYVDAVEKLNESESNSFWQGSAPLVIGDRIRTGSSDPFNGVIDDVRIYDRALTAGEIWQLYQNGLP